MMSLFSSVETWVSLLTLSALEVILGVDNLIFISVLTERLPSPQQRLARQLGLLLACLSRLLLLLIVIWLTGFTQPLLTLVNHAFSGRDLALMAGGVFLLAKATRELHLSINHNGENAKVKHSARWLSVVLQIMVLDIVFSLDSVITAVGMVQEWIVMVLAIIIAVGLMLWASEPLSRIISTYPSFKVLGLSFLLLVGIILIADGSGLHIPRAYLYFAITFSAFVEWLNIRVNQRHRC